AGGGGGGVPLPRAEFGGGLPRKRDALGSRGPGGDLYAGGGPGGGPPEAGGDLCRGVRDRPGELAPTGTLRPALGGEAIHGALQRVAAGGAAPRGPPPLSQVRDHPRPPPPRARTVNT